MNVRALLRQVRSGLVKPSVALDNLDRQLDSWIGKRRGVFVEAGANDGIKQSNTLFLEEHRGWTGLLIEAIPSLAAQCRINRPHAKVENCALVARDYAHAAIEICYCDLMSIVRGAMPTVEEENRHVQSGMQYLRQDESTYRATVPARTLSEVLDSHGLDQIDLLSLDVEGYESEVLRGLDYDRHLPAFLLIEVRQEADVTCALAGRYDCVAVLSQHRSYSDILYACR